MLTRKSLSVQHRQVLASQLTKPYERDEIIAAFGESIILRGRAADEAHELKINFNTECTVEGLPVLDQKKISIGNYPLHSDAIG